MLLIDAHVHIHDCYDISRFLQAARSSFRSAAARNGDGSTAENGITGVLLLTESAGKDAFHSLARLVDTEQQTIPGAGTVYSTGEAESLRVQMEDGCQLFIIAGRQIVTAEKLEVLAPGMAASYPDGRPMEQVLSEVRENDALPVIPWGFGKWIGRRGEIVEHLLETHDPEDFFLGDNGGRSAIGPFPRLFRKGQSLGFRILPGSDPLPFSKDVRRVGSYGIQVSTAVSPDYPAADVKRILQDLTVLVLPYGRLEQPIPFLRNQVAMQFKKRGR